MANQPVISARNLSKAYRIWQDPAQRLLGPLLAEAAKWVPGPPGAALRRRAHLAYQDFFALRGVSFEIQRGESVGIIGRNGSGKSTLLQVLAHTLQPTSGEVQVRGKVAALLELGSGFNPEFTGRENIYLNASILGLSKREVQERFDDIAAFADIGEFLDQPVKTYSSGMSLRLAFAVQTAVEPDILIVDEALAVGDMFFQAKCMARLRRMINDGLTLLLVSHEPSTIKSLCSRGLLLERGQLVSDDASDRVAEKYFALRVGAAAREPTERPTTKTTVSTANPVDDAWKQLEENRGEFDRLAAFQRGGNGHAHFVNVQLLDSAGLPLTSIPFGVPCRLRLGLCIERDLPHLTWGVHIRDEHQRDILYTDATRFGSDLSNLRAGERVIVDLAIRLQLKEGRYSVHVGCAAPVDLAIGQVDYCDLIPIACQFYAERPTPFPIYAPVLLEAEGRCQRLPP